MNPFLLFCSQLRIKIAEKTEISSLGRATNLQVKQKVTGNHIPIFPKNKHGNSQIFKKKEVMESHDQLLVYSFLKIESILI